MNNNFNFTITNVIWIVGLVFATGIAYSQITYLEREIEKIDNKYQEKIEILHRRLEKKTRIVDEHADKIHDLELKLAKKECH